MVKKSQLKWSLVLPFLLFVLALIVVVIYIILPTIISFLLVAPNGSDVCSSAANPPSGSDLVGSLHSLCSSGKSFLGVTAMLLIILAGFSSLIPMLLVILDVLDSKIYDARKALLIIAVLLFGFLAAALYYFIEVRKRKD